MLKLIFACYIYLLPFVPFNKSTEVSEATKHKMFCNAYNNSASTSQDYVVIKVKNVKTGVVKEICTTINMLIGAVIQESGKLRLGLDCKKYVDRYFEFSQDDALQNIRFDNYSMEDFTAFSQKLNVDSVVKEVKRGAMRRVNLPDMEELYFAHLMFNHGVVTTSGCFGTNVHYFE